MAPYTVTSFCEAEHYLSWAPPHFPILNTDYFSAHLELSPSQTTKFSLIVFLHTLYNSSPNSGIDPTAFRSTTQTLGKLSALWHLPGLLPEAGHPPSGLIHSRSPFSPLAFLGFQNQKPTRMQPYFLPGMLPYCAMST